MVVPTETVTESSLRVLIVTFVFKFLCEFPHLLGFGQVLRIKFIEDRVSQTCKRLK